MTGPEVAPNYPVDPPPSITVQVNVTRETLWIHKEHEAIAAHYYEMVLGLSCLQMGAWDELAKKEVLLIPAVFVTKDNFSINTTNFGEIKFPEHFERVGIL